MGYPGHVRLMVNLRCTLQSWGQFGELWRRNEGFQEGVDVWQSIKVGDKHSKHVCMAGRPTSQGYKGVSCGQIKHDVE